MNLSLDKQRLFAVASLACLAGPVAAASELAVEVGVENFRWQEFDDQGHRLLTEQGPRLVAGAGLGNTVGRTAGWLYEFQVQGYLGQVDYDGQDSSGIFTSSDTDYRGGRAEITTGLRRPGRKSPLAADLLLAAGAEYWKRDINDSRNANGAAVGGFTEEYTVYYGRLGAAISWPHRHGESNFQAGGKRPFAIDEDVDVFNVTLSPGEEWSAFAAYEYRLASSKGVSLVRLYYDSFRFAKSDPKSVGLSTVWQPESDMDIWGISFTHVF